MRTRALLHVECVMPNICDSVQCARFVRMLEHCEGLSPYAMTDWEKQFVSDLREKFDHRDQDEDMGVSPWQPSVNQWNTLHELYEKNR